MWGPTTLTSQSLPAVTMLQSRPGRCPRNRKTSVRIQSIFTSTSAFQERKFFKNLCSPSKNQIDRNEARKWSIMSSGIYLMDYSRSLNFSYFITWLIFHITYKQGNKSQRRLLDGLGAIGWETIPYYLEQFDLNECISTKFSERIMAVSEMISSSGCL